MSIDNEQQKLCVSLIRKTFNAVQDEIFFEEKKEYFKNYFSNALTDPPQDLPQLNLQIFFINCLSQLNIKHIELLKYLDRTVEINPREGATVRAFTTGGFETLDEINRRGGELPLELHAVIQVLFSLGLIRKRENRYSEKEYAIDNLGKEFIKYCLQK